MEHIIRVLKELLGSPEDGSPNGSGDETVVC